MKVGIFSYNKYSLYMNFGAALHSFAFQKALNKLGIESYIIDYKSKHVEDFNFNNLLLTNFKKRKINSIRNLVSSAINTGSLRAKYKKFTKFYDTNCTMYSDNGAPFYHSKFLEGKYKKFPFTTVVCESDVTWSPLTNDGFDRVLFFDFDCFDGINKVAYSPSISNTKLTNSQEREFKNLLSNYDYLSSREDDTANYVAKITGRECEWVLDPVLLLDNVEYHPYIKELPYKDYVLVYNCMKNDRNLLKEAQAYADSKNLKLIEISDYNQNKILYNHKVLTNLGIEEFLYMFNNASYIFTNGYHGACFSIVFNKEFYLFARDGVDIKIKSLLRLFQLEDRYVELGQPINRNVTRIDYENTNKIRLNEIKRSTEYIMSSIK